MTTETSMQISPEQADAIGRVLADVHEERIRQLRKWGVQRRADDTGGATLQGEAEQAKRTCQAMEEHVKGGAGWRLVLAEEAAEAFAEREPAPLRAELIQTAAVCVAWVEDLDSRGVLPTTGAAGISPLVDQLRGLRQLRDNARTLADRVGACAPPNIADGFDLCTCGSGEAWPCATTRAVWAVSGIDSDAEIKRVCDAAKFEMWSAEGSDPEEYHGP